MRLKQLHGYPRLPFFCRSFARRRPAIASPMLASVLLRQKALCSGELRRYVDLGCITAHRPRWICDRCRSPDPFHRRQAHSGAIKAGKARGIGMGVLWRPTHRAAFRGPEVWLAGSRVHRQGVRLPSPRTHPQRNRARRQIGLLTGD